MNAYFALCLRKSRLVAAGLLAAFGVTLLIAPASVRSAHVPPRQALDAALLFWAVIGVPGAALILGASAGAGTRADESLEDGLPLSSERRAALSMAASAAVLALVAAVVGAGAAAFGSDWRVAASIFPAVEPMLAQYLWVVALVAADALVLAFGAAFAIGGGAAGGIAAFIAALLLHAFLFGAFTLHLVAPPRGSFAGLLAFCSAGALGTALGAARSAARRRRAQGAAWRAAARHAGMVLAGLLFVFVATRVWVERVYDRLEPNPSPIRSYALTREGGLVIQPVPVEGRLLSSIKGRLAWDAGGRVTALVPDAAKRPEEVQEYPFLAWSDVYLLRDGTVWVVRRDPTDRTELWTGRLPGPLTRAAVLRDPPRVEMVVDGPAGPELVAFNPRSRAKLELKAPLRWKPLPWGVKLRPFTLRLPKLPGE